MSLSHSLAYPTFSSPSLCLFSFFCDSFFLGHRVLCCFSGKVSLSWASISFSLPPLSRRMKDQQRPREICPFPYCGPECTVVSNWDNTEREKGKRASFPLPLFLLLLRSISSQFHGGRARNDLEREWGRERKGERDCRRMCRKKGERNKWPDSHIISRRKRMKNSANL